MVVGQTDFAIASLLVVLAYATPIAVTALVTLFIVFAEDSSIAVTALVTLFIVHAAFSDSWRFWHFAGCFNRKPISRK